MKVKFIPQNVEFDIKPGQSVMHVAQDHNLYIKSVCKGVPSCAECRVKVVDGEHNVLPPGSEELSLIGTGHFIDRRRLSCQLKCFGDITVDLTEQIAKEQGLVSGQKKKKLAIKDDRIEDAQKIRSSEGSDAGGDSGTESSESSGALTEAADATPALAPSPAPAPVTAPRPQPQGRPVQARSGERPQNRGGGRDGGGGGQRSRPPGDRPPQAPRGERPQAEGDEPKGGGRKRRRRGGRGGGGGSGPRPPGAGPGPSRGPAQN